MFDCQNPLLWLKQCHKTPMTAHGNHTTFKNGDLGGWFIFVLTTYTVGFVKWGEANSWMVYFMHNPMKNWWFRGTTISGNFHILGTYAHRLTDTSWFSVVFV